MRRPSPLSGLSELTGPESFEPFRSSIDPEWIEQALEASGTATLRKRRLPANQVVWLVIAIALYRELSITDVVANLDLKLKGRDGRTVVAPSAVSDARGRLGSEPMKWLFERSAQTWTEQSANEDRWRGLALYGVDGTTLRVADSEENASHFGYAKSGRGHSGYPMVRIAALIALRSHLLLRVAFGAYDKGEHHYASSLWEHVPDNSLMLVDKNFLSAALLDELHCERSNRHWLVPAKSNTKMKTVQSLGAHDELVELNVCKDARAKNPNLGKTWRARAIRYQRKGFRPRVLLTSLIDSTKYPAEQVVELYHERWEQELAYGEIKTDMLDAVHRPLRSKSPERVEQELWGLFVAFNLIRLEMTRIAADAGVSPTRISFVQCARFLQTKFLILAFVRPGNIAKTLQQYRQQLSRFLLPKRRPTRSYPRAVKNKMSNYPKKNPRKNTK